MAIWQSKHIVKQSWTQKQHLETLSCLLQFVPKVAKNSPQVFQVTEFPKDSRFSKFVATPRKQECYCTTSFNSQHHELHTIISSLATFRG